MSYSWGEWVGEHPQNDFKASTREWLIDEAVKLALQGYAPMPEGKTAVGARFRPKPGTLCLCEKPFTVHGENGECP